jgi:hypothetical protein
MVCQNVKCVVYAFFGAREPVSVPIMDRHDAYMATVGRDLLR